jgi:ferredoxin-NADP reductase/MOSC domain-containing protein YiiM/ferredoxin
VVDALGVDSPVAGRLLAVSVGRPREVTWRGRVVRTAIWKSPVADRRWVGRLNVDGDGQADLMGHGVAHRAVFVYQQQSYAYWEQQLGRSFSEWGTFGENFTVDGLADDAVCVGDRLGIGTAVFEVTQPRVTCFKVGMRLEEPRMPALLTGHGRPGFYLRVVEEGEVGAGDEIRVVGRDPRGLTVRRVSDLLYTSARDEPSLRAALDVPALSEGWQWSFHQLLTGGVAEGNPGLAPQPTGLPAYPGYRAFTVTRLVWESAHVLSVHFVAADGAATPSWRSGQFVPVRLRDAAGPVVRSYSLSGPQGSELRISVKREGRGSDCIHGLTVGSTLEVGAPRGGFGFDPAGDAPVVLISAGIGVTPVLACLLAQARLEPRRRLIWVHVARSPAEHSFAAETDAALAAMPTAVRHVRYTAPEAAGLGDADGRLTLAALGDLGVDPSFTAYVCGPGGFAAAVTQMADALGLPAEAVHVETFGSAASARSDPRLDALVAVRPHLPSPPAESGWPVTFVRAGVTAAFDPSRWTSLLELAEACDVGVRWSCRAGVCHSCESQLVEGEVEYAYAPVEAPGGNVVLVCCARPSAAVTLDL